MGKVEVSEDQKHEFLFYLAQILLVQFMLLFTKVDKILADDNVGCVVTTKTPGLLAITGKHRYLLLDWETGQVTSIAEIDQDRPENNLNDGKCDAKGRFWAGE